MIQAVIIIAAVLAGLAAIGVRAAGPHLPEVLLGATGLVVVIMAASVALVKGASRHALVSWTPHERLSRDQMLPAPASPRAIAAPAPRGDPFTADGPAWDELVERAEREELARRGPRESRVIAPQCEGPGCAERLDDNPWKVLTADGGEAEEHLFCSGECAEEWQRQDAVQDPRGRRQRLP